MGRLRSASPFFRAGPPAEVGNPSLEIVNFLMLHMEGEILDMGGGLGAYSHALKAKGYSVTLAEKDRGCLESVRRLNIPVLDMNVTPWKELEKRFDTIMLVEVLEHIENPAEFLAQTLSCCRKKMLLTVPCNDDFEMLFHFGLTYNHIAVEDHLQQFTSKDIAVLLTELGVRYELQLGSPLFPAGILPLLVRSMAGNPLGRMALLPLRLLNRFGWLPPLFPSRIFVVIYPAT